MTIYQQLEQVFRTAFDRLDIPQEVPIVLQESSRPEFGDYQVNGIMAAAKKLKINPRELANQVVALLSTEPLIAKLEVAGPGFINVTVSDQALATLLNQDILAVPANHSQTIVVDYSAPNLAKEMHVGHLRSTVIGDALVRIYEFLGHRVLRRNHVGDWGTQFGMLTAYLVEVQAAGSQARNLALSDLEEFYRQAKVRFDADSQFAATAREYVVRLQSGDPEILALWQQFVTVSLSHCQQIYDRLGTRLTPQDIVGESFYNDLLAPMVKRLVDSGIAVDSDGAKCVFFAAGEISSNEETPFIIQKKDGAYLYATTDIAAVYDRVQHLQANRLVYVIDSRQALHMKQLFAVAKKAGIATADTLMEHAAFGTMMGDDGKPFKTRTGGTVKLIELINEARERAFAMIKERNPQWPEAEVAQLADTLSIAAIKYADLSKNRLSDYIFSFDKMLAFEGNTAPYLLYAYARIMSIFKKAQIETTATSPAAIQITEYDEHRLAVHLAKFADKLMVTAAENYPHYLCGYLYDLAGLFMKFYESCPILKDEVAQELQQSRLALAALSAQVLKTGLDLLGINVVDKM
jgi:arginyl-tRNA synthetase